MVGTATILLTAAVAALEWRRIDQIVQPRQAGIAAVRRMAPRTERPATQYVSSDKCRSCHPRAYHSWHQSYHRTMTQLALPENVLSDFAEAEISSAGLLYRVFRDGDELWAEAPDPDILLSAARGNPNKPLESVVDFAAIPRVKRQVVLATGSHHYQTYWTASAAFDGVLNTLPLIYLPVEDRWVPREAAFMDSR